MTSTPTEELRPLTRIFLLAAGYGIYVLAGPGILLPGGTPFGALGLVFWALACSRPGPWKKRIEWILGAAAFTSQTTWMGIVFWFALVWLFIGYGCWAVWGGWLMKRLSRGLPLSIATPLAWVGFESLLAWTPPPIGLSWLRLGHYLADFPGLAGSGRVWGGMGLGFVLASLAGLCADLVRSHSFSLGRRAWVGGLLPAVLGTLFALVVQPPETEPGPRILLVQPAVEQARKQTSGDPRELFFESIDLTRSGLARVAQGGGRAPDLVCWGETMFPGMFSADGLESEIAELEVVPWSRLSDLSPQERVDFVTSSRFLERDLLANFFGKRGLFQREGQSVTTSFLSGVEILQAYEGRLRRTNSIVLWRDGERTGRGLKRHLAPGGETMVGLEAFKVVRDIIYEVANYVPDFLAGEETSVMSLAGERGRVWPMATSICFDNAFADVYAAPLREGDVDFHLVVSNEAWYLGAQELDQMVAFSRMHALCTARSFVRCANSGVSCAIGPDGREFARLRVNRSDREVTGTLNVDVPVPIPAEAGGRTPYVWLQPWLLPLGALLPLLLLFLGRRKVEIAY